MRRSHPPLCTLTVSKISLEQEIPTQLSLENPWRLARPPTSPPSLAPNPKLLGFTQLARGPDRVTHLVQDTFATSPWPKFTPSVAYQLRTTLSRSQVNSCPTQHIGLELPRRASHFGTKDHHCISPKTNSTCQCRTSNCTQGPVG